MGGKKETVRSTSGCDAGFGGPAIQLNVKRDMLVQCLFIYGSKLSAAKDKSQVDEWMNCLSRAPENPM